ncbi:MAG: M20/M25/M40 family metallo-hydrolase [Faecalibacterium sp.]|nr:M20/M25/M40 family metallo-hydrolase [Ruminococcus sp.]MCM1392249.1 M20/M25/M40 family metallo-hydrolase [Ruminococcus sp.]MCM1484952.1 M20/M25/M40 family metallo-hydrolase [Faecalibacterium sp.]
MTTKELCFLLANKNGTSGDEKDACEAAKDILSKYMTVHTDRLGNVIGTCGDGRVNILLDAHIDRVGLVVRGIDDKGFLLVDKVGGADVRIMTGAKVTVFGKKELTGVVCSTPPHLLSAAQKEAGADILKMAIDIGFSRQEAESLVEIGDRAIIHGEQLELLGNRIASPAFDDRCGIAAVIKAIEMVHDKIKNVRLSVQFTSQEEVGGSGATVGAYNALADYAIAVDVGFGDDTFCHKAETIELGKGPSIGISPVLDRVLMQSLKDIAKKNDIPYQHDVMSSLTGTNADKINISRGGVKTALLSIPLRSMHTPVEVIDLSDIDNTAKLIAAFILEKDGELDA